MDMTSMFRLLDEFQAVYRRHYRYVAGKWWVLTDDYWTTHDARVRMGRALVRLAEDIWPEGHSVRRQASRDYMITRLCAGLVPRFLSDRLPGRTEELSE
jgi:hypothetical protein